MSFLICFMRQLMTALTEMQNCGKTIFLFANFQKFSDVAN